MRELSGEGHNQSHFHLSTWVFKIIERFLLLLARHTKYPTFKHVHRIPMFSVKQERRLDIPPVSFKHGVPLLELLSTVSSWLGDTLWQPQLPTIFFNNKII